MFISELFIKVRRAMQLFNDKLFKIFHVSQNEKINSFIDSNSEKIKSDKVHKAYQETQLLKLPREIVNEEALKLLSDNWKDERIPKLQRKVVDVQLENLRKGVVDPVFASLITALKTVSLDIFSLLDAACATGYYLEAIKLLDKRRIHYQGCDYSASMIALAKSYYPDTEFEVQDLTCLGYANRSFDVVLVSGVLEHIPDYRKAIKEICRVAKHYVIFHRFPLTPKPEHEYTTGSQYTIKTPRIYFAKKRFLSDMQIEGYRLIKEIDTYPIHCYFLSRLKAVVRKTIQREAVSEGAVKTLVFQNQNPIRP